MIRAMFTAISSLNNNQKFLDVVSNNLANANTTGYKSSRVLFQDQYAQLMSPGAAPATNVGGINPTEIGLGVKIGYVSPNFVQGMLSSTGRNMDLGIQGDGFFIYGGAQGRRYSREGSMNLDADGVLVNSSTGLRTQGWMAAANKIDSTMPTTDIKLTTDKTLAKATANVNLGGNLTSTSAVGDKITVSVGVYDSLGQLQKANIVFTRSAVVAGPPITNPWAWQIFNTATPPVSGTGTGTVTFDANGQYVSSTAGTAVSIPGSAGAGAVTPIIDFSKLTALASATSASITSQDGLAAGTVSDVYISPNDGIISLVYSNGLRETVGQVALARFTNPSGLIRAENTSFIVGANSGDPEVGAGNTGGRGAIASGYLEGSNVDMAQEFTNMILAQRGFQASSRVITTSDEIMQELVALKR